MAKVIDLTGKVFGKLTVIERGADKVQPSGQKKVRWLCQCSCGNPNLLLVDANNLRSGHTKSCGCHALEMASKSHKGHNKFDLTQEYGIGFTSSDEEFYFDLEDYDKIKDFCWRIDKKDGYVLTTYKGKIILFHRFVMNVNDTKYDVDHRSHVKKDNRKCNLRITERYQNASNKTPSKEDVSGVIFNKQKNKWVARIGHKRKTIHLGYFTDREDAVSCS